MGADDLEDFKKATMGVNHRGYDLLNQLDPEYFKAFKELYANATFCREGAALPRKIKELIMIAVTTATGKTLGTRIHTKRALLAGATAREILETLQTAAIPAGMPVLWAGVEVLAEELKAIGKEAS